MPPEVKLLGMLGMSGYRYHLSRQMLSKAAKSMPGFNDVMGADPELRRRYTDTAARMGQQNGVPGPPQMPFQPQAFQGQGFQSVRPMPPMAQPAPAAPSGKQGSGSPPPRKAPVNRVPMREPDDVDGLLASIKGKRVKERSEMNLSDMDGSN